MVSDQSLELPIRSYLDWLTVERGRSKRTVSSYRIDLESYRSFLSERGVEVTKASAQDVDAHLAALTTQGRSPATVARARSSIRGFHRFMSEEGFSIHDPSQSAPVVRVPARIPKALAEEQVLGLLDGVGGDDALSLRDRAILELLYGTGARVSEITALDLDDLAFDNGLLRLTGKGDKERLVPIGRAAQAALGRWLEPSGRGRVVEMASGRSDHRPLFLNQRGRRISRQGVHLVVSRRAELAGIPTPVSPHVLRHSCATHMLAHGADVRVVQELLGHASVATTQLYTKVNPEHLRAAYSATHPRSGR